ncbi:TetR/AcrR family transcriptional regulator [Deinococcus hopiensis]|uniref:Transcriptional regulator, TetR family n=1 Tax=Deinococcus hopiensis KR-140 TaxID=695939 RepID=A0A1W1VVS5_9DEIO|nr:TetR/AcrR family transcriptional regulator [Deinococcus hopiensis]SMB97477.1 transcriptional regulator, TetR family [Deinococcus hopiensis KR-140]
MTDGLAITRRERHKQEKLTRIQDSAWRLFTEQGFEATTIRQIADQADVATGTVFSYAADKADLLLMVFHHAIARTRTHAFTPELFDHPLDQALFLVFQPFFELYRNHRGLASDFIRIVLFHQGPWRDREWQQVQEFLQQLGDHLQERQRRGELRTGVDMHAAAFSIFALYQATLVGWLTGGAPYEAAQQRFREVVELYQYALLNPPFTSRPG